MKEIVKVLLAEGIDEGTIHEVLDIIEGLSPEHISKRQHQRVTAAEKVLPHRESKHNQNLGALNKYKEENVQVVPNDGDAYMPYAEVPKDSQEYNKLFRNVIKSKAKVNKAKDVIKTEGQGSQSKNGSIVGRAHRSKKFYEASL